MVPFDPFDFWTDAGGTPPVVTDDRRRRWAGYAASRLILFALLPRLVEMLGFLRRS